MNQPDALKMTTKAAEQSVKCLVHTGIVREATSVLKTVEQEVLMSERSDSSVLARIEQLELQLGI